jgi:hypothetical protein
MSDEPYYFTFEEWDDGNRNDNTPLVEQVMENMSVYARPVDDERFRPQAEQLLNAFQAIEGRPAVDYLEIEEWSLRHLDIKAARFLVLPGGRS